MAATATKVAVEVGLRFPILGVTEKLDISPALWEMIELAKSFLALLDFEHTVLRWLWSTVMILLMGFSTGNHLRFDHVCTSNETGHESVCEPRGDWGSSGEMSWKGCVHMHAHVHVQRWEGGCEKAEVRH